MKTEFLQNFKVGDQPLPKEIIDAILAENGRDVEAAKKPFADYGHIKEQLKTAQDGLKAFEGIDVSKLQGEITTLRGQLSDKDREWQGKLDAMAFDGRVRDAIAAAGGRSARAVSALLDLDALRSSKNQDADIKAALEALNAGEAALYRVNTALGSKAGKALDRETRTKIKEAERTLERVLKHKKADKLTPVDVNAINTAREALSAVAAPLVARWESEKA